MAKGKVGLGRQGETLAAELLERHGFRIAARNWFCAEGEADIIAERGGEWYFFEARTRRGQRYGTPEESIAPRKRARMESVARRYLSEAAAGVEDPPWHLGLAAIELDHTGKLLRITLYPDLEGDPLDL